MRETLPQKVEGENNFLIVVLWFLQAHCFTLPPPSSLSFLPLIYTQKDKHYAKWTIRISAFLFGHF